MKDLLFINLNIQFFDRQQQRTFFMAFLAPVSRQFNHVSALSTMAALTITIPAASVPVFDFLLFAVQKKCTFFFTRTAAPGYSFFSWQILFPSEKQFSYNRAMKNKLDILKELKSLKQELHDKYHVEKLGIFGSYATDCANEESDLDVIIEFLEEQPEAYRIKNEIKSILQKKIGLKVDLARERFLKPYFKEEILKQVIYVKKPW